MLYLLNTYLFSTKIWHENLAPIGRVNGGKIRQGEGTPWEYHITSKVYGPMTQWVPDHFSEQETHTNTHRPISSLGQPPQHLYQIRVCPICSYTESTLSVLTRSYLDKNNDTLVLPSSGVTTMNRFFTDCKQKCSFILVSRTATLTSICAWTRTTRLTTSI